MTTIDQALRDARRRFEAISESPGLDAHILLAEALGVERAYLLAHPEQSLAPEPAARFESWTRRHAAGEPVAYILGRRGFYDRDFYVTPDVLIPRPETELLLERALKFACSLDAPLAADIGTGSGALAVTFAAHCPRAAVYAVDVSEAALAVARRNAETHGVEAAITFARGSLLQPLIDRGLKLDLVMANLPYIPSHEVPGLAVSRYEPSLALDGGPDGLALVRQLVAQLPAACRPGALALLEIGADQGPAALALVGGRGRIIRDYAGLDRILELTPLDAGG
jgi:release factor glutamine methyltransferase